MILNDLSDEIFTKFNTNSFFASDTLKILILMSLQKALKACKT